MTAAEMLAAYRPIPARELDRVPPGASGLETQLAEARRVGGSVRWHRAEGRAVVAVKVGGRWFYRP